MGYPLVLIVTAFVISMLSFGQSMTTVQTAKLKDQAVNQTVEALFLYKYFLCNAAKSMNLNQLPTTIGTPMFFAVNRQSMAGATPINFQSSPAVPSTPDSSEWLPEEFDRLQFNNVLFFDDAQRVIRILVWSENQAPEFIHSLIIGSRHGTQIFVKGTNLLTSQQYRNYTITLPNNVNALITDGTYVLMSVAHSPLP